MGGGGGGGGGRIHVVGYMVRLRPKGVPYIPGSVGRGQGPARCY